jgi:hypothetical protein
MQAFFDEHLGMVVNVVSPVLAEQADKISQKKKIQSKIFNGGNICMALLLFCLSLLMKKKLKWFPYS